MTNHFRFADLKSFDDPSFLPGSVKYGDLPALMAVSAPHSLRVAGEQPTDIAIVKSAYDTAGQAGRFVFDAASPDDAPIRAADWLLEK